MARPRHVVRVVRARRVRVLDDVHRGPLPAARGGDVPAAGAPPQRPGLRRRGARGADAARRHRAAAGPRVAHVGGQRPALRPHARPARGAARCSCPRPTPASRRTSGGARACPGRPSSRRSAAGAGRRSRCWCWCCRSRSCTACGSPAPGPRDLQELIDAGVAMIATWLLLHAAYRRLVPTEYLLAAAGALILPALAGTYLAFPRYGMTVFVLAWLLALHASRRRLDLGLRIALPVSMVRLRRARRTAPASTRRRRLRPAIRHSPGPWSTASRRWSRRCGACWCAGRRPRGDWAAAGWRTPDPAGLLRQHDAFCALLDGLGCEVVVAPAVDGLVDACFTYDPAFVIASGAILLRCPKPVRASRAGRARAGARGGRRAGRRDGCTAPRAPTAATSAGWTSGR